MLLKGVPLMDLRNFNRLWMTLPVILEARILIQKLYKLIAHRGYMEGYRKTTPFLHPDTWQDDNEGNLTNMK